MPAKKDDALFDTIERFHGDRPCGRILDAGTGEHSLGWLLSLDHAGVTALTGAPARERDMRSAFASELGPEDRVLTGNWTDPLLLHGETFDTVVADYLLGAMDGFAPYFQDALFGRMAPHVGGRLYVVGLEPIPYRADTEGGRLIMEINRLRDACILLANHRCYREYPRDWVINNLGRHGFVVEEVETIGIVYRQGYVDNQLDVCRRKLPYIKDKRLTVELSRHIEQLRERCRHHLEVHGPIPFGSDYVIAARRGDGGS